jgi:hypothetical protein
VVRNKFSDPKYQGGFIAFLTMLINYFSLL